MDELAVDCALRRHLRCAEALRGLCGTTCRTENSGIVLPKMNLILGPWVSTEFFANYGEGYHSNARTIGSCTGVLNACASQSYEVVCGRSPGGLKA